MKRFLTCAAIILMASVIAAEVKKYKIISFDPVTATVELEEIVAPVPPPVTKRLINAQDISYIGSFRCPRVAYNSQDQYKTFAYGGNVAAYHSNGLFLSSHTYSEWVAKISIPTPVNGAVDTLPIADFTQPFGEITGGLRGQIESPRMGGLHARGESLLWTAYTFYDANLTAAFSHGKSSLTTSAPVAQGMYKVGQLNPGYVAGYMIDTPVDWQDRLKPVLTGQCGLSIITRTSTGPALIGFDPVQLAAATPSEDYVYYPEADGKRFAESWLRFNVARGGAFISDNTKYGIALIGWQSVGEVWYGGQTSPNGKIDPCSNASGTHSESKRAVVWFYDPNDLVAAKAGIKQPWEVRPYLETPIANSTLASGCVSIGAVTYDNTGKKLYVIQSLAETVGYDQLPIVHVFSIGE